MQRVVVDEFGEEVCVVCWCFVLWLYFVEVDLQVVVGQLVGVFVISEVVIDDGDVV